MHTVLRANIKCTWNYRLSMLDFLVRLKTGVNWINYSISPLNKCANALWSVIRRNLKGTKKSNFSALVKGCITLKCFVNSVNVCQELAPETFQRPLLTYETRFVFAFLQLLSCNNSEKIFRFQEAYEMYVSQPVPGDKYRLRMITKIVRGAFGAFIVN